MRSNRKNIKISQKISGHKNEKKKRNPREIPFLFYKFSFEFFSQIFEFLWLELTKGNLKMFLPSSVADVVDLSLRNWNLKFAPSTPTFLP